MGAGQSQAHDSHTLLEHVQLVKHDEDGTSSSKASSMSAAQAAEASKLREELDKLREKEADHKRRLGELGKSQTELKQEVELTERSIQTTEASLRDLECPPEAQIRKKKEEIAELEGDLERLTAVYENKKNAIEERIEEKQRELEVHERALEELEAAANVEEPYPGPSKLSFMDSDLFHAIASCVIISNIWVMFLEFVKNQEEEFKTIDVCFMLFYTVELILNIVYKQRRFFFDSFTHVWGNWLDFIIVVTGIFDMFVIPIMTGGNKAGLSWLRILRLARLARVLKIVKIFLHSNMHWAEGPQFQSFMMAVIAINCLVMGLEVEFAGAALWFWVEHLLLVIYTFELLVRLKLNGLHYFCDCKELFWNWLDFIIVAGAILDQWVMPSVELASSLMGNAAGADVEIAPFMNMLRLARLLRILRLVRLVKGIPPLFTLVSGIAKAMQGMGWVMVLSIGVLYICALLGVKLVGQGMALPEEFRDDKEVMGTFKDIPDGIFHLFMAMNADLGGVEPLVNKVPASRWIMMAFMIVTNWAIFSILTAVVSDNMAKVTESHDEEVEQEEERRKREENRMRLNKIFQSMDKDGSNTINKEEFNKLLSDDLQSQEMSELTGLEKDDLDTIFELLARRDAENPEQLVISHGDFMEGLDREKNQVTLRYVMMLEKKLEGIEDMLEQVAAKESMPLQRIKTPSVTKPSATAKA